MCKTCITTPLLYRGKNFSSTAVTVFDIITAWCSAYAELPCKTKSCKGLRGKRVPDISMISRMAGRSSCGNYTFPLSQGVILSSHSVSDHDVLNQLLSFMSTAETPSGISWHFFFPILPPFPSLFIYKHILICKAYCACGDKGKLRSKLLGVLPHSILSTCPVSLSNALFHKTWWWTKVRH